MINVTFRAQLFFISDADILELVCRGVIDRNTYISMTISLPLETSLRAYVGLKPEANLSPFPVSKVRCLLFPFGKALGSKVNVLSVEEATDGPGGHCT